MDDPRFDHDPHFPVAAVANAGAVLDPRFNHEAQTVPNVGPSQDAEYAIAAARCVEHVPNAPAFARSLLTAVPQIPPSPSTVAAWTVLGTPDDIDSSDSEYVRSRYVSRPIHFPARTRTADGLADAVLMLIDSGAVAVLIDNRYVASLNLRRRKLPFDFNYKTANSQLGVSREWVKLRITNESLSWTLCTARAIVMPNLCDPVILGLPWIKANGIVINGATEHVTAHGVDVSVPPPPPPVPPPSLIKIQHRRAERYALRAEHDALTAFWLNKVKRDVIRELSFRQYIPAVIEDAPIVDDPAFASVP